MPLPVKVMPPALLMTPEKVVFAVVLLVMVRTAEPRLTPPLQTTDAPVLVFERPKFPPSTMVGLAKVRFPVPLLNIVPPLMLRVVLAPPKDEFPETLTTPALRVKLLPAARVLPCAPRIQVPLPDLVIAAAAAVDQFWVTQLRVTLSATLTVLPPALQVRVPACEMVVLPFTVIFPTVAVAKVTLFVPPFATPKITFVPDTQLLLKVPEPVVFQFAAVHVASVPFVFQ